MSYDPHRMSDGRAIREFILAGNAYFTIVSLASGTRFTYRVSQSEDGRVHFVSVLTGPESYTYIGIYRDGAFWHGRKSAIGPDAPSVRAIQWFFKQTEQTRLPDSVEFWHEGRCGRCGRQLTVPESIERGIGPECASRMGLA